MVYKANDAIQYLARYNSDQVKNCCAEIDKELERHIKSNNKDLFVIKFCNISKWTADVVVSKYLDAGWSIQLNDDITGGKSVFTFKIGFNKELSSYKKAWTIDEILELKDTIKEHLK